MPARFPDPKQPLFANFKNAPSRIAKMGSNLSFGGSQKSFEEIEKGTAQYLAFARDQLRFHLVLEGRQKDIPDPVLPRDVHGYEENGMDSDSSNDFDMDNGRNNERNTQPPFYHIPTGITSQLSFEQQNAIRDFEFINTTADDMELSEQELDQEDGEESMEGVAQTQSGKQSTETHHYPDPQSSQLVPPPTPRLSHSSLPIPFIGIDISSSITYKLPDAAMQESEDGDLSDINHVRRNNDEKSLPPIESDASNNVTDKTVDAAMQNSENEDLSTSDADVHLPKENAGSKNTTNEIVDAVIQQPEDKIQDFVMNKRRSPLSPVLSSEYTLGHQNRFTDFQLIDLTDKSLPEQAPAEEPATWATPKENAVQDEVFEQLPIKTMKIFENESIREAEAENARAKAELIRVECQAHGETDSEHFDRPDYYRRSHGSAVVISGRKRRATTLEQSQATKSDRSFWPAWKKHCVWQRSLLAKETKLMPDLDDSGVHMTWINFHKGAGLTGGNPKRLGFKYCNLCERHCSGS